MSPVSLEYSATFSGFATIWRNCQAPSGFLQELLMPHCQDAPPIFGPFPKSGGGRKRASSAYFLTTSLAPQLPLYHRAVRPCKNAWSSAGFGLTYLFLKRFWNQSPHAFASGPFSAPSAVV